MARARSSKSPGSKSSFQDFVVQSILVPKSHPDVKRSGLKGATRVAERHGGHAGKVDETSNYFRFRQFDPKLGSGDYVTLSLPGGVKIVSVSLSRKAAATVLCHDVGACVVGEARRRVACTDRYRDRTKSIDVIARSTIKEHDAMPEKITLGELIHQLGKSRVSVTSKKMTAKRGNADVIPIGRARKVGSRRAVTEERAVANNPNSRSRVYTYGVMDSKHQRRIHEGKATSLAVAIKKATALARKQKSSASVFDPKWQLVATASADGHVWRASDKSEWDNIAARRNPTTGSTVDWFWK